MLEAEAEETLFTSLATTLIVLGPFGEQVTLILLVVEEPEHPAGRVQVYVYGAVPPVVVVVHVNGLPEVAAPQLGAVVTTFAAALMTMLCCTKAVAPFASVTVTLTL